MKSRIVICGFGFMGQLHAANILRRDDAELVAVINPTAKEKIKPVSGNIAGAALNWSELDNIPFFAGWPQAFYGCDFDAVVIASPTLHHAKGAVECIRHNRHVFVEKPLCATPAQIEELKTAIAGSSSIFHAGHVVRFMPEYLFLRELVSSEKYGKLRCLKLLRRTGVPSWGAWADKDTSIASITGPVFDLNIHDIDFALSLLGKPVAILAELEPCGNKLFNSTFRYDNGVTVEIDGGFADESGYPFRAGFTAVFDNAVLEYNSLAADKLVLSTGGRSESVVTSQDDAYRLEMEAFINEIHGGTSEHCSLDDAALAVEYSLEIIDKLKA